MSIVHSLCKLKDVLHNQYDVYNESGIIVKNIYRHHILILEIIYKKNNLKISSSFLNRLKSKRKLIGF